VVIRLRDATWEPLRMLHADDLSVHPLRADGRGLTAFVQFVPGWTRHRPVSCTVDEQFVVLAGTLQINDAVAGAGSLVHVPAGTPRTSTSTEEGCLAIAWFGGIPRWHTEEPVPPSPLLPVALDRLGGGQAVCHGPVTWTVLPELRGGPSARSCELVDLDDPGWTPLLAGAPEPVSAHRHLRRSERVA
jgi:hypothetical protein